MAEREYERPEGDLLTRDEVTAKEPPMYKVVLLNDNYTTMEFVVHVLEVVFHKSPAEAAEIMLSVHQDGAGVAGIYVKEVAETKVAIIYTLAKQNEFPLKCILEPA